MQKEKQEAGRNIPAQDQLRPKPISGSLQDERIRAIMSEFEKPLDNEDWSAKPRASDQSGAQKFLRRIRRHRRHRSDLKLARQAAQQVFGTKPSISTRKRATLMMGAGAMSLAAFTGPPTSTSHANQQMVMSVEDNDIRKPTALLKASDAFKQALIEEEGVRYTVYRDVAGYPTVGVGHLITPQDNLRIGDRVSEDQVLKFLEQDLKIAERGVRTLASDLPLFQHEFDALLDLVYNVGLGNASEGKSPKLNAAIADGDYDGIAVELDYTHAGGKVARGLEFRSERRAQIFMDGTYENPREL